MVRLYTPDFLAENEQCTLSPDQNHYLTTVLRLKVGGSFSLFNEQGEWGATIQEISKKQTIAQLGKQLRQKEILPEVWLAFALLKHDAMGFLLEKATELGVTHLQPLITDRTNTHRFHAQRAQQQVIDASQQCERLCIPTIHPVLSFQDFLNTLSKDVRWFCALERENTPLFSHFDGPVGFLVGPEGGWSVNESNLLNTKKGITSVTLGPRILRAETAALCLLARQI